MKGFFIALTAMVLSLSAAGSGSFIDPAARGFEVKYQRVSSVEMKLDFSAADFSVSVVEKDGVKYSRINGAGSIVTNDKGSAELPYHATAVQLKDDRNVTMKYSSTDYTDIQLDYPLLPSRGVISRSQNIDEIPYEIAKESAKNEWYPGKMSEMTDPFIMRDVRGTNIVVYPYQYNSVTRTLRIYKTVNVSLTENDEEAINPLTVKPEKVVTEMNGLYNSIFVNYNESKALSIGSQGELLVIYTSSNGGLATLQPWIDWKRQKGFKVTLLEKTNGTDLYVTQDIKNAYLANTNILYAQIVGDFPNLKSQVLNSVTSTTGSQDPMLGCTAGTDQYIDVVVGRFSVSTADELTNQINKSISYEKTPALAATWYEKGIGIASNEGAGSGDDGEGDQAHSDIIIANKLLPFTYASVDKAYQANSVTKSTILGYINNGRSLINYTGHGNYDCWQSIYGGYLYNADVNSLTNGTMLPFVLSVACLVGNIEYASSPCFGETWVRKSGGGAVAGWFSTISQPWLPPMRGQDYFNDILKGGYDYSSQPGDGTNVTEQRTTVGTICANASNLMLAEAPTDASTKDTQESWTILGDVTLQLRTDPPKQVTNSNTALSTGSYTTTVTATTGGAAVANAMVTLYKDGVSYTGLTNSSGTVSVSHGFASGSAVTLTVSGFNLETEQSSLTVGGTATVPAVPALATPANASSTTDLTPTFDWNDVSGATSYTIMVDNTSTFASPEVNQSVTSSTYTPAANLAAGTYYWKVLATNATGSSAYTTAWTVVLQNTTGVTLPVSNTFASTTLPTGWTITDNVGAGQVWQIGTMTGGLTTTTYYAYLNSDAYGSGKTQNSDLVTPVINMAGATNVTLAFKHYFKAYTGSSGTLAYSINGGTSWTTIQTWTASSTNPTTFSQVVTAVAGQANVKFKWNYTGTYGYHWNVDDISIASGTTPTVPAVPTLATPANAGSTTDLTPTFDWNDVSGATSYTILADNNSDFSSPEINQSPTASTYTPTTNLAVGTYYWKVLAKNATGSSAYTTAWTVVLSTTSTPVTLVTTDFPTTTLPTGWTIVDNVGAGQVWKIGTHTGGLGGTPVNYAYLNSDAYGSGKTQNSDLVTPVINCSGKTSITLTFNHYFRSYTGSSAKLYYSINGGSTWTLLQTWTATTTNPTAYSQVITAVAGQASVKFKWNYTGTYGYYWDVDNIKVTGVASKDRESEEEMILVNNFALYQNYPNPFNPATTIKFALEYRSDVKLTVYNIKGELVTTLKNGTMEKGVHTVSFDASTLNSGVYIYRLDANGRTDAKKMILTK